MLLVTVISLGCLLLLVTVASLGCLLFLVTVVRLGSLLFLVTGYADLLSAADMINSAASFTNMLKQPAVFATLLAACMR